MNINFSAIATLLYTTLFKQKLLRKLLLIFVKMVMRRKIVLNGTSIYLNENNFTIYDMEKIEKGSCVKFNKMINRSLESVHLNFFLKRDSGEK